MKYNLYNILFLISTISGLKGVPPGRFAHNSIINKKEVWILGGSQKPDGYNRTCIQDAGGPIAEGLWKYDINTKKWQFDEIEFTERRGATLVRNTKKIYMHGGGVVDGENSFRSIPLADMWEYKNDKWCEIKTNSPPIYAHQSVIDSKNNIYSLGGLDADGRSGYLHKFNGKEWTKEETPFSEKIDEFGGLMGHTMTLIENELIYVIGGVFGMPIDKNNYNEEVWVYSINTNKWTIVCGGIPLQGHSASKIERIKILAGLPYCNDDIIISGGYYPTEDEVNDEGATHLGGTSDNIYCFNTRRKTWKSVAQLEKPREFHTSVIRNKKLYIYGGYHIGYFWDDMEIIELE